MTSKNHWVLIAAVLVFASACSTPPVADGESLTFAVPQPQTLADAQARIERAAAAEDWQTRRVREGRSLLTVMWGEYIGRSVIDYDKNAFTIRYIGSANLESPDGVVHGAYYARVARLARRIEADTGR